MVLKNIGNRIRDERLRARLTQWQLAEKAGCNESYIGQIERGVKNPSLEIIVNIANALNITVDFLISDNIKTDQINGLFDEAIAILKNRDPEEIRILINVNRLFLDLMDRKEKQK
jgi:transcriptional regulator with XRE-family HTH domain